MQFFHEYGWFLKIRGLILNEGGHSKHNHLSVSAQFSYEHEVAMQACSHVYKSRLHGAYNYGFSNYCLFNIHPTSVSISRARLGNSRRSRIDISPVEGTPSRSSPYVENFHRDTCAPFAPSKLTVRLAASRKHLTVRTTPIPFTHEFFTIFNVRRAGRSIPA